MIFMISFDFFLWKKQTKRESPTMKKASTRMRQLSRLGKDIVSEGRVSVSLLSDRHRAMEAPEEGSTFVFLLPVMV